MRAGLATLDVLEHEGLGERAPRWAPICACNLPKRSRLTKWSKAIRGLGMLNGIQFTAPKQLRLRVAFEAFQRIHPAMFGQVLVMRLFRDKGILTQICGNNFMVLKVAPPLVVTELQLDEFVDSVRDVVHLIHHSGIFWTDALGLARRAVGI